jgi:membrane-associated protease RseP (regulator of RpoE activity)
VSDDTPTGETEPASTPADEPSTPSEPAAPSADATAAEPGASEPATLDPESPQPVAAESAAAEPVTAEPVAAEPVTAEPVTAETTAAPPTAVPVAPVAAATPPPERRNGILLPIWVAVLVAVLLIGGIGFAIGYATGDDGGSDAANASSSQVVPNGNGSTVPDRNGNGNGNSNGNENGTGNGNGGGQTAAQIAFLGVALDNAAANGGATITGVRDGSPAADGGLKAGDVITKVGDTAVTNQRDLVTAIQAHKPGDTVTITYTRNGTSAQATVTLGDRSEATRSSVSP